MQALYWLIDTILGIYLWLLIAQVVLSWLVQFNVLNTSNRAVYVIGDFLYKVTEPALRPIRRIVPDLGGIDISPIILALIIGFARRLLPDLFLSLM